MDILLVFIKFMKLVNLGFGILFIRILLLSIGIQKGERKRKREVCTKKVDATIVDIYFNTYDISIPVYFAVYEYQIGEETIRKASYMGVKFPKIEIGQKSEILVNPDNLKEIYDPNGAVQSVNPKFYVAGGILLIISLLIFWLL